MTKLFKHFLLEWVVPNSCVNQSPNVENLTVVTDKNMAVVVRF